MIYLKLILRTTIVIFCTTLAVSIAQAQITNQEFSLASDNLTPADEETPDVYSELSPSCSSVSGGFLLGHTLNAGKSITLPSTGPTSTTYVTDIKVVKKYGLVLGLQNNTLAYSEDAGCTYQEAFKIEPAPNNILKFSNLTNDDKFLIYTLNGNFIAQVNISKSAGKVRFNAQSINFKNTIYGAGINIYDTRHLRIVGDNGFIYDSLNSGISFKRKAATSLGNMYEASIDSQDINHIVSGTMEFGTSVTFDGGKTWSRSGGFPSKNMNAFNVKIAENSPSVIWTLALNMNELDTNKMRAFYRSIDGGKTFKKEIEQEKIYGKGFTNGTPFLIAADNPHKIFFLIQEEWGSPAGTYLAQYQANALESKSKTEFIPGRFIYSLGHHLSKPQLLHLGFYRVVHTP